MVFYNHLNGTPLHHGYMAIIERLGKVPIIIELAIAFVSISASNAQ